MRRASISAAAAAVATVLGCCAAGCAAREPGFKAPAFTPPPPGYAPSSVALFEADAIAAACRRVETPSFPVPHGRSLTIDDEVQLNAIAECLVRGPLRSSTVGVVSGADSTAQRIKTYFVARGASPDRVITGVQAGRPPNTVDINVLTPAARMPTRPETLPQGSQGP